MSPYYSVHENIFQHVPWENVTEMQEYITSPFIINSVPATVGSFPHFSPFLQNFILLIVNFFRFFFNHKPQSIYCNIFVFLLFLLRKSFSFYETLPFSVYIFAIVSLTYRITSQVFTPLCFAFSTQSQFSF